MKKLDAINKLEKLRDEAKTLFGLGNDSQKFKRWYRDTEVAIEKIFGKTGRHYDDFIDIYFYPLAISLFNGTGDTFKTYKEGLETAITTLESFIDEIKEYGIDNPSQDKSVNVDVTENIKLIINRFHKIARQLRSRYSNRQTIEIEDEYDVQDLFHSLLKLYFDDIRPEEYTPSYAGGASRVDFLLKNEKIIIEIKKTRKGLGAKEVGEQLIIDSHRYQVHPDCDKLICFVYDPEARIANPRGIESDLSKDINGVPVSVYIRPEE